MELTNSAPISKINGTTLNEVGPAERESFIDVAIAVDEAAYLTGWDDAIRAVLGAKRNASSSEPDDYFEGWMDAITQRPIDPTRIATSRASYALGYADGAREYEQVHRGGYDAE